MKTNWLLREMKRTGYYKTAQLATALGYYWLLCLADRTILAPAFGYQGLGYQSVSILTQICIVGLIVLCTTLTPVRLRQPSDGVLYVLLPLVVIPVLTIAATDDLFASVAHSLIIDVTGAYLLLATCSMLPRRPIKAAARQPRRRPWTLAIILSIVSYTMMFVTFGVHLQLLSFSDVYGVRAAFGEQANGATGYLLDWQANVINPVFIVYGIRSRRRLILLTGVFGDFLIYCTTGFKSIVFSVLAIVAFLPAMRKRGSGAMPPATGVRLGAASAVLVATSYLIDTFSHSIAWTSLFVRRLSLVPGVNTAYYFQYFSNEPKSHLGYGLVAKLLGEGGTISPTRQIAIFAYHTTIGNPNANLWADAYANFGQLGIVLFTLILAGFLWFYDRLAGNVDRQEATILLMVPALSLANSALLTSLLTHGLLLTLLVITQWPRVSPQSAEPAGMPANSGTRPVQPAGI